ncbi:MAG: hypothetical protein ACKVVT_02670 [Dehalococcoidia bacterium]
MVTPREPALQRIARRAITLPGFVIVWLGYLVVAIPLLVLAVLADLVAHRQFVITRSVLMAGVYLTAEVFAIVASVALWLRRPAMLPDTYARANFDLQCRWARWLFQSGRFLFGLRVEVSGEDALRPGPIIAFTRHVCVVDNLLPAVFLSDRHRIRLRWVLNRSLLRDAALDLVGNRLPNAFVRGGLDAGEREVMMVADLARDLGPDEGVLIFPEGALFNPGRRGRVLARLRETGDPALAARAERLQHVLPPRLGGALALLEAAPAAGAVFCAHSGLERATGYREIFNGGLVHQTLRIHFWRVPAADIPADRDARVGWLFDQWEAVDRFVGEHQA